MSAISSNLPLDGAVRQTTNRFGELSSEEFIQIIFTELSNQDPFSPNDTSALLEQLNSIRSIESDIKLTEKMESLVFENKLASAGALIGNFIGGMTEDFNRVAGYVVSVIRQGDDITLELDNGWLVPIENVETIIDPDLLEEEEAGGDTPPAV